MALLRRVPSDGVVAAGAFRGFRSRGSHAVTTISAAGATGPRTTSSSPCTGLGFGVRRWVETVLVCSVQCEVLTVCSQRRSEDVQLNGEAAHRLRE